MEWCLLGEEAAFFERFRLLLACFDVREGGVLDIKQEGWTRDERRLTGRCPGRCARCKKERNGRQ